MEPIRAIEAYSSIEELCKYGPRNVNSEGDLKSVEFISKVLQENGFEVFERPFIIGIYTERKSEILVRQEEHKFSLDCVSHYRSGATRAGGIEREVVYVGFGTEEEVNEKDVKGKICLADTGKIHPVSKADIADKHGSAGCIWIHGHPGNIIAAWGLHKFGAPLPIMGVSYEDGARLKDMIEKKIGVMAKLIVDATVSEGEGKNIIGYKRGGTDEEVIALCAHRETTHTTPGANDNGSGVAVLLEIAKAVHSSLLKRSLALIFSSGEEGGGFGMQDYLDKYADEAIKYKVCINLDMVGEGSKLRLVEKGRKSSAEEYMHTSQWLNSLLKKTAMDLGYHIGDDIVCEFGMADAGHFINRNVHAAWFYKPDDPYFHTKEDTPDKVNPNDLKVTGDIILKAFEEIQNMKTIPKLGGR